MSNSESPKIESNTVEDLMKKFTELIPYYTKKWDPKFDDDSGIVLGKLFVNILDTVHKRLNKIPQRNFIAFLDMLGLKLIPAKAAITPVTINPLEQIEKEALIPKGTQVVGTSPIDSKPVIFETESTFLSTFSKIKKIFHWYRRFDEIYEFSDKYENKTPMTIFNHDPEENLQKHMMYLGHTDLFNLRPNSKIFIRLYSKENLSDLKEIVDNDLLTRWEFLFDADTPNEQIHELATFTDSQIFDEYLEVYLQIPEDLEEISEFEFNDIKTRWLRFRLINPSDLKRIDSIRLKISKFLRNNFQAVQHADIIKLVKIIESGCKHCNGKKLENFFNKWYTKNNLVKQQTVDDWNEITRCKTIQLDKNSEIISEGEYLHCFSIPEIYKVCAAVDLACGKPPIEDQCENYGGCCNEIGGWEPVPSITPTRSQIRNQEYGRISTEYLTRTNGMVVCYDSLGCIQENLGTLIPNAWSELDLNERFADFEGIWDKIPNYSSIVGNIELYQNEILSARDKIKNECQILSGALLELENKHAHLVAEKENLNNNRDEKHNLVQSLELEIYNLQQNRDEARNQLIEKQEGIFRLDKTLEEIEISLELRLDNDQRIRKEVENMEDEKNNIESRNFEIKPIIQTEQSIIHEITEERHEIDRDQTTYQSELIEKQELIPRLNFLQSVLSQKNNELSINKNKIRSMSEEIEKKQKSLRPIMNSRNVLNSNIKNLKNEMLEFRGNETRINRIRLDLRSYTSLLKYQNNRILNIRNKVRTMGKEIEENSINTTNLETEVTALTKDRNSIQTRMLELDTILENKRQIQVQKAQIHREAELNDRLSNLNALDLERKNNLQRLEEIKTETNDKESQILKPEELDGINQIIETHKEQKTTLSEEIDLVNSEINNVESNLEQFIHEKNIAETQLTSITQQLDSLETSLGSMSFEDVNFKLNSIETKKKEILDSIKDNLNDEKFQTIDQNNMNLIQHTKEIKPLRTITREIPKKVNEIHSYIESIHSEIIELEEHPETMVPEDFSITTTNLCDYLENMSNSLSSVKEIAINGKNSHVWNFYETFSPSIEEILEISQQIDSSTNLIKNLSLEIISLLDRLPYFQNNDPFVRQSVNSSTKILEYVKKTNNLHSETVLLAESFYLYSETTAAVRGEFINFIENFVDDFDLMNENVDEMIGCKQSLVDCAEKITHEISVQVELEINRRLDDLEKRFVDQYKRKQWSISQPCDRLPDFLFYNDSQLNFTDFHPLGKHPFPHDTFYIADNEAFSKKCQKVSIDIIYHDNNFLETYDDSRQLRWEYFNGKIWQKLSIDKSDYTKTKTDEIDETGKRYEFYIPTDIEKTTLHDIENYWIRIKLIQGDYGVVRYVRNDTETESVFESDYASITPPLINNISINLPDSGSFFVELPYCETQNNLIYKNCIVDERLIPFRPFELLDESKSSMYLGFDKKLTNGPVSIYFDIEPDYNTYDEKPAVDFYYYNGTWEKLQIKDNTDGLTASTTMQFLIPTDFKIKNQFGQYLYWLKISNANKKLIPRTIRNIYLNTVMASNSISIHNEIIGSSNNTPNQKFILKNSPVADTEIKIWVKEKEVLDDIQRNELKNSGKLIEITDVHGKLQEQWILWQQTVSFVNSNSTDRHYTVEKVTRKIQFGDGEKGLIPIEGLNNIKADYRMGGGIQGNISSKNIKSLLKNIPYVNTVSNPISADGGNDQETISQLLERGPHTLKNRTQAITKEDYEWLILENFPSVEKIKCFPALTPNGIEKGGCITLVLIPKSSDEKPLPTLMLLKSIHDFLDEKNDVTIISKNLNVVAPEYVNTNISGKIIASRIEDIPMVELKIKESLNEFLHPLNGGRVRNGWEFGDVICLSDLYGLLEKIPEIDHIDALSVEGNYEKDNRPAFITNEFETKRIEILPQMLISRGKYNFEVGVNDDNS